jgi:hypothetical protein
MGAVWKCLPVAELGKRRSDPIKRVFPSDFAFSADCAFQPRRVAPLGTQTFQTLNKMLTLKRKQGAEYALETELVVRLSTGPARKHKLKLRHNG